jgi:ATPase subunit of ABC transporter with duplicated ATPase domains
VILQFTDPETLSPPILQFRDVSFGYSLEKPLFRNLNLGIDLESRVALVGANGVGKSTLLNLMGNYKIVLLSNIF